MLNAETKQQSEEMIKVLNQSDNADDQDDIPVVVILGASGSGKTRTAFDVSRNRYTLYFPHSSSHFCDLKEAILAAGQSHRDKVSQIPLRQVVKGFFIVSLSCAHSSPSFWIWKGNFTIRLIACSTTMHGLIIIIANLLHT